MHDSTLDLFCHHQAEQCAMMLEQTAKELEISTDYYIEEFLLDDEQLFGAF